MYACMYVCMYVCMYGCMDVCMFVCMYVCMYVCVYMCMYVCMSECSLIIGAGCRVQVFAWSSIAQSVCQRAFSLLAIWCLGHRVQILHSAEEDNLSPFDLNIACLCQSIEINNNKYVYRQSQVRKSTDSGAKWAECSLIIGTGCRVQVFAWSSIAQSVCQGAFSLLAIWCLGTRVQILYSAEEHNLSPFDLNIVCMRQSIEINNNKYVCMYVCMYVEREGLSFSIQINWVMYLRCFEVVCRMIDSCGRFTVLHTSYVAIVSITIMIWVHHEAFHPYMLQCVYWAKT